MIEYKFDVGRNIVDVWPAKKLSIEEMVHYVDRLINDESVHKHFIEYVHFEGVEDFSWSYADTDTILRLFQRLYESKHQEGAILLVDTNLQLGMARMIQTVFTGHLRIDIARSKDEANRFIEKIRSQK